MDYYDNSASSSQNIGNINRKIQVRGGLFKIVLCHVCPPKTSGRMDLDLTVMYLFIHLLQENTNYSYPKPNLPIGKWSLFAAAWSPGLTAAVKLVLLDFLMENPRQKKFSALEWQQHVQQGHIPYRRDCRLCVQEMGQDRPHRRRHPGGEAVYIMAVDIAGPFQEGWDYGRASAAKYALIAIVPVPVKQSSRKSCLKAGGD